MIERRNVDLSFRWFEAAGKAHDLPPDGPGGRNVAVDFRGGKRSNMTHAFITDPDALFYRKSRGTGAQLCYMGHVLMENRNGLAVDAVTMRVSGHAERLAAPEMRDDMIDPYAARRITPGHGIATLPSACVSGNGSKRCLAG